FVALQSIESLFVKQKGTGVWLPCRDHFQNDFGKKGCICPLLNVCAHGKIGFNQLTGFDPYIRISLPTFQPHKAARLKYVCKPFPAPPGALGNSTQSTKSGGVKRHKAIRLAMVACAKNDCICFECFHLPETLDRTRFQTSLAF